ncbi:hypothetical protein HA402_000194 [Bradysia odoriphaga]|nr:hypothetical protein HA402_000194 [Bradysia odoriphaga]
MIVILIEFSFLQIQIGVITMKRYTQLPLTLYRIQPRLPVALRDYDNQIAKARTSFDLKLDEKGFVQPLAEGTLFTTPNGMTLRPASDMMLQILKSFRGKPMVYQFACGMKLPKGFVVYHEHTDHYSLQTTEPIMLQAFNSRLTELLQSLPMQTREQFINQMDDDNDQDN